MTARVPCPDCGIELLPTAMPGHIARVHTLPSGKPVATDLVYGRQGGRIVRAAPTQDLPRCTVCGEAMAMGQPGRHLTCVAEDPLDAAGPPTLF